MGRLRSLFLDDRGQTAAEFVGVLLLVALIVAVVAASGAGETARVSSNDTTTEGFVPRTKGGPVP